MLPYITVTAIRLEDIYWEEMHVVGMVSPALIPDSQGPGCV